MLHIPLLYMTWMAFGILNFYVWLLNDDFRCGSFFFIITKSSASFNPVYQMSTDNLWDTFMIHSCIKNGSSSRMKGPHQANFCLTNKSVEDASWGKTIRDDLCKAIKQYASNTGDISKTIVLNSISRTMGSGISEMTPSRGFCVEWVASLVGLVFTATG